MLGELSMKADQDVLGTVKMTKERLLRLCGAIFVHFLLEKEVEEESESFKDVCARYDFIFYDINQMYLCDFLPVLAPLTARSYLAKVGANSDVLM